jgi:hypothetical protein
MSSAGLGERELMNRTGDAPVPVGDTVFDFRRCL